MNWEEKLLLWIAKEHSNWGVQRRSGTGWSGEGAGDIATYCCNQFSAVIAVNKTCPCEAWSRGPGFLGP